MAQNYQNKSLERIRLILEFIKEQSEVNPSQETFSFSESKMRNTSPLFHDRDLMKLAFEKILEGTNGKVKIEYRIIDGGFHITATEGRVKDYITELWFHVEDRRKLNEYYNQITKKIEKENKNYIFILDMEGHFYPEGGGNNLRHNFRLKSLRYRLLLLLARRKTFVTTQDIADDLNENSLIKVRGAVEEIRAVVARKMNLPRESIIENYLDGEGYRVTNVVVKEA